MSLTFLTLKRKWILLFLCLLFVVASVVVYFTAIKPAFMPKVVRTIVIDAGHGGLDVKLGLQGNKKSISLDMLFKLIRI